MLNERELGTVLAALRYYQNDMQAEGAAWSHGDISTDGGTLKPLSVTEIDSLCEGLNCGPLPVTLAVVLEGGMVSDVVSDDPARFAGAHVVVIDYDTEGADEEDLLDVPQKGGTAAQARAHFEVIDKASIGLPQVVASLKKRER